LRYFLRYTVFIKVRIKGAEMTYVVTKKCLDCKDGACLNVCPVDCFVDGDGNTVVDISSLKTVTAQVYINPEECIDCRVCEPECPCEAIYADNEVPTDYPDAIDNNKKAAEGQLYSHDGPPRTLYTKEHDWLTVHGTTATVGIKAHAIRQLGDIAFFEIAQSSHQHVSQGLRIGAVKSSQDVRALKMPISGKIIAINKDVIDDPSVLNARLSGENIWLYKIKLKRKTFKEEESLLLKLQQYQAYIGESVKNTFNEKRLEAVVANIKRMTALQQAAVAKIERKHLKKIAQLKQQHAQRIAKQARKIKKIKRKKK